MCCFTLVWEEATAHSRRPLATPRILCEPSAVFSLVYHLSSTPMQPRLVRTMRCSHIGAKRSSLRQPVLLPHRATSTLLRVQDAKSSGSGSADSLESKFNSFVRAAQPKLESFADDLKSSARRTYTRLDSEYDLTDRAAKAAKRVKETAKDVDQQYGVRRRVRSAVEQLQRSWPAWSRWFETFSATPAGKFTIIGGVFILMTTPIFWRVVNGLVLLWWLALPIGTFLVSRSQQQQAQAAAAEEAERRRNPLASIFRASGFGGKKKDSTKDKSYGGPVIDAEWRSVDDKQ